MFIKIISTYSTRIAIVCALFLGGIITGLGQEQIAPEGDAGDYITYQGRLAVGGLPANGTFEFEFTVSDVNGTAIQTVQVSDVPVVNGIFTARLLLNLATFTTSGGTTIGVGVRQLPTEPFMQLSPRQPISSTPYAFKSQISDFARSSLDAGRLGGMPPDQFITVTDARLTDARAPLPGSSNYIQNGTALQTVACDIQR